MFHMAAPALNTAKHSSIMTSAMTLSAVACAKLKFWNPDWRMRYGSVVVAPAGPPFVSIYMMEKELKDQTNKSIVHRLSIGLIHGSLI